MREYKKTTRVKEPKAKIEKAKKIKPKIASEMAKNKERVKDKPYWIKQADKWFSYYVRLLYADKDLYVICYTCGVRLFRKLMHNCHWEERANYFTRRLLDNCKPGCTGCNTYNPEKHKRIMTLKLTRELGIDRLEEMNATKYNLAKMNVVEIKETALYRKEKAKALALEKGVELK